MLIDLLLGQTTLTALEEMFQGARSIMSWLGLCAKVRLKLLVLFCAVSKHVDDDGINIFKSQSHAHGMFDHLRKPLFTKRSDGFFWGFLPT